MSDKELTSLCRKVAILETTLRCARAVAATSYSPKDQMLAVINQGLNMIDSESNLIVHKRDSKGRFQKVKDIHDGEVPRESN